MGTIHLLPDGAWCTLGPDGEVVATGGEAWRWLRWRRTDPGVDGPLVAAEAFGALPTGRAATVMDSHPNVSSDK